jgi:GH25 family lysozyme M1 (1,4-beta-N-acetylmuramidase)
MKPNTCLVVDVWEGQLEIDEVVLKANGVAGMGIRLNDMNGGHHMDTNFVKQWTEAKNFVRFPYFVYNPWVDGAANYAWLTANLPAEVKVLALDLEVRKTGYPAATYAKEVGRFLELCKPRWKVIIYTGQWFLPYVETWPKIDYWWAQYPDPTTYFGGVKSWDDLKIRLDRLDKPFNAKTIPGTLKLWQLSGDFMILPGNNRPIDINLFFGTEQQLAEYFGMPYTAPEPQRNYYRLLHDTELQKWGYQPRPMTGVDATPETVRLNGGIGNVTLSAAWEKFITRINTEGANRFIRKPFNGWMNRGKWPQVEQLSFAGNVVEVTEIVDGKAYIKCLYNDEAPPALVGEFYDPATMHIFGVIRADGTLEGPPVGNTRILVMARNRAEKLWIPLDQLVKVDKLSVYVPPGVRVDPPPSVKSGLYYFSSVNYFQRPGDGPLTLPMSRQRKLGDNLTRIHWPTLKKLLLRLNAANPDAVDKIAAPDWGPSKGLDGDYIKWIGLLWPGRNVVKIEEVVDGWGRVEGIGLFKAAVDGLSSPGGLVDTAPLVDLASADLTKLNPTDNPDLVHMVYDYNKANGYGERAKPVFVPILGGPWWVDMTKLISVDSVLPKTVTVKAFPRLRVRSGPGMDFGVTGYKYFGEGVAVQQVTINVGGLWGKFSGGWIALRNNGTNLTDWRI